MRRFLIIFICLFAVFMPYTVKAETTTLKTQCSGRSITVKVKTDIRDATNVDVTITGANLWKLHRYGTLKHGSASVTYDDLMPGVQYTLEVTPFKTVRSGHWYFRSETIKAKTKSNKIRAYNGTKEAGEAIYKDFAKGKEGTYMIRTKKKINAYKDLYQYVYNNSGQKMGCILFEYQRISINPGNVENVKSGNHYYTSVTTDIGYTQVGNSQKKFELAIAKADRIIKSLRKKMKGKSKKAQIYVLYNYLAKNCTYTMSARHAGSPYGALIDKKAYCLGYATGFALLCKRAGFNAIPVQGVAHAYTAVSVNGRIYVCDPTFDDAGSFAAKRYFMKTRADKFFKDDTHDIRLAISSLRKAHGFSGKFY